MTYAIEMTPLSIAAKVESHKVDESDKRILIVDDDESVRKMFAACLSERYSCVTVANAQEALAYLEREPFALLISDMLMPGRSGIELLREVGTRFPDTAVIIASGVDRTQRVLEAVRLGAFDYLIKPCEMDVLELTVERALERRAFLRDAQRYQQELELLEIELTHNKAELKSARDLIAHSQQTSNLCQLTALLERLLTLYNTAPPPTDASAKTDVIKEKIHCDALTNPHLMTIDCSDDERVPVEQKVVLQLLEQLSCRADSVVTERAALRALMRVAYDIIIKDSQVSEATH